MNILKGEIELDESYFGGKRKGKRGRGAAGKTIVFGILERGGKVSVETVKNVTAETLMSETVKKVRRGSIVYTDKWKGYDSLMFSGYKHLNIDHRYKFKEGKVFINGVEGFWSFAKERLIKYHGISKHKFILYLKEMEWRYNNRNEDLFEMLVYYMLGRNELRITKTNLSYNKFSNFLCSISHQKGFFQAGTLIASSSYECIYRMSHSTSNSMKTKRVKAL